MNINEHFIIKYERKEVIIKYNFQKTIIMDTITDYIYCSNCLVSVNETNSETFRISSCGKLYCTLKCAQKSKIENCTSCPTCQTILLQDAPPDVAEYFTNTEKMLEKISKILKFQSTLRSNLENNFKKKYAEIKTEYSRMRNFCMDLQKEHRRLQKFVKENNAKPSMPPKSPANPSIFNFSQTPRTPRSGGPVSSANNSFYRAPQGYSSAATTPGSFRSIPSSTTSYASPVELLSNFARSNTRV